MRPRRTSSPVPVSLFRSFEVLGGFFFQGLGLRELAFQSFNQGLGFKSFTVSGSHVHILRFRA